MEVGEGEERALRLVPDHRQDEQEPHRDEHDPQRGRPADLAERTLGLAQRELLEVGGDGTGLRRAAHGGPLPMVAPAEDKGSAQRIPESSSSVIDV